MKIKKISTFFAAAFIVCLSFLPFMIVRGTIQAAPSMSGSFIDSRTMRLTIAGDNFANLKSSDGVTFTGVGPLVQGVVGNNPRCGLMLTIQRPIPPNTSGKVMIAQPGTVQPGTNGGSPLAGCSQSVASQFMNAPVSINNNNSNVDNPSTKKIRATTLIDYEGADLTDTGLDAIDASKAPGTDTLTLKNASGAEVARKQANRQTTPDGVTYTVTFDNINAGTYQLCSVVADRCIPAVKKTSEILNITIEAPKGKYDIRSEPTGEEPQSCTERMALSAGWIVCSVLELVSDGISSLFDIADSMLNVDGQNLYDSGELRAIWSYFRVVATFALVIIGLVMVISQAIGGGL